MLRILLILFLVSLSTTSYAGDTLQTICNSALQKKRNGLEIPIADKEKSKKAFNQYYEDLSKKYGTDNNCDFGESDRTKFYIAAVKMAIIDPETHGGWPFHSTLRHLVFNGLKSFISLSDDPFILFCSIFPALERGEKEHAVKAFEKLQKVDKFLADLTLTWSRMYFKEPEWISNYYIAQGQQDKSR